MENPETTNEEADHLPELRFFAPGQVCLLVEHQSADLSQVFATNGEGIIYNYFSNELGVSISNPAVTQFTNAKPEGSMLQAQAVMPDEAASANQPAFTFTSVARLDVALSDGSEVDDSTIQQLINRFSEATSNQTVPIMMNDEIALRSVSPNWYFSASPDAITTGGPGSDPEPWEPDGTVPSLAIQDNLLIFFQELVANLRKLLGDAASAFIPGWLAQAEDGTPPVDVVILDTAPSQADILKFNHARVLNDKANFHIGYVHDNPGLLGILPPDEGHSKVAVVNANDPTLKNYRMSSHGLFIAGIIHRLAPDANIHLIQILNNNGVGTLDALIQALNLIGSATPYTDHKTRPTTIQSANIIINCSLTIGFTEDLFGDNFTGTMADFVKLFQLIMERFISEQKFEQVSGKNVKIFAAAGNDSTSGNHKPARYPARYDSVVGVGALGADGNLASYSNQADSPADQGITILGGSRVQGADGQTPPQEKLVGYFVDAAFPNGTVNDTGWAYWAGTSFATGVMSGFMARMISELGAGTLDRAEEWLRFAQAQVPVKIMVDQKFE